MCKQWSPHLCFPLVPLAWSCQQDFSNSSDTSDTNSVVLDKRGRHLENTYELVSSIHWKCYSSEEVSWASFHVFAYTFISLISDNISRCIWFSCIHECYLNELSVMFARRLSTLNVAAMSLAFAIDVSIFGRQYQFFFVVCPIKAWILPVLPLSMLMNSPASPRMMLSLWMSCTPTPEALQTAALGSRSLLGTLIFIPMVEVSSQVAIWGKHCVWLLRKAWEVRLLWNKRYNIPRETWIALQGILQGKISERHRNMFFQVPLKVIL